MKYERIYRAAINEAWAIQPEKLEAILEFLGGIQSTLGAKAAIEAAAIESKQRAADLRSTAGSVAVLSLFGLISHRASMVDNISGPGGTSTAKFSQALWSAVNDPSVKAIVIDCDSPGGTVEGVQELADDIMRAKAKKPITAIADCCMASAAYWICSAASEIVASPSSSVGSIGVFSAHEDHSAALDSQGVKVSLISAGKYKTEGNPYQPLDDAARANMQSTVDSFYSMFVDSIARGRGISASKVVDKYGQGRMLPAADALKAGMVDRIATLDAVLSKMGAPGQQGRRASIVSGNAIQAGTPQTITVRPIETKLSAPSVPRNAPRNLLPEASLGGTIIMHRTNATPPAPAPPSTVSNGRHITSVHDNRQDRPWANFGEQLQAIAIASASHVGRERADPRLFAAALGNNEAVPSDGGFLVSPQFSPDLLRQVYDASKLAGRCTPQTMSKLQLTVPVADESSRVDGSRWGAIESYWAPEGTPYVASTPKFRHMNLYGNKLIGLLPVTDELFGDTSGLNDYASTAFPSEFAFRLDDAIVNGNGVGIPLGYLNSPALIAVPKDSGQTSRTITASNVVNMISRLPAWCEDTAVWLCGVDAKPQLLSLTQTAGTAVVPLYTSRGAYGNRFAMLAGYPLLFIEQAATLGTLGDLTLVDLSEYVLAKSANGIRTDQSIHVQFVSDQMLFRFMLRADGQPTRNVPITPKNGSVTVSPFIALQSR